MCVGELCVMCMVDKVCVKMCGDVVMCDDVCELLICRFECGVCLMNVN